MNPCTSRGAASMTGINFFASIASAGGRSARVKIGTDRVQKEIYGNCRSRPRKNPEKLIPIKAITRGPVQSAMVCGAGPRAAWRPVLNELRQD
jgi:hypothetical protein